MFSALTWNIECIKPHQYFLSDVLLSQLPDIVSLSEPMVFLSDIDLYMKTVSHEYSYWLNSNDRLDPELSLSTSRAVGGTLAMWRKHLDPYTTVHPTQSSAVLPLVIQLPGAKISAHIAVYLPTSGKDAEFVTELATLQNCIDELDNIYNSPIIFVRGDFNVNRKNSTRVGLLQSFITKYSFCQVKIDHPTYHHFTGDGMYDSNLDIILYSNHTDVSEAVTQVMCKFLHPEVSSHHDLLLSQFSLPSQDRTENDENLEQAPRTNLIRNKILWSQEGAENYCELVSTQLRQLRLVCPSMPCRAATSVIIQSTNHMLNLAASLTNQSFSLNEIKSRKAITVSTKVKTARNRLKAKYRYMRRIQSESSKAQYELAKQRYRQIIRKNRLEQYVKRDKKLDSILTRDPSKIYSFLRSCKQTKTMKIDKLIVEDKVYTGAMVGDGFYESMRELKSCNLQSLSEDPLLSEHFTNYQHILKICESQSTIPEISLTKAADILKRLKTHVIDIYGITALHFINAGKEGLTHFAYLLNCVIADVNNGKVDDLNQALGIILYKGHHKNKNSHRSYRTISTCPVTAKALDLYIRDLFQPKWDACTAPTQYQTSGSSHELASLLITEVIQYSLNLADQPVYLLVLDAQSAFDRCLRQILCSELFRSGVSGSALLLINNRLENRSTVYQWDGDMLGPAQDITGFEQGGINSGDYYKLYNNTQLLGAQSSCLGVNIGSSTISAVGQADDVILAANSVDSLQLLANLTESYCSSYRVKLVPSKTKLLPLYHPRHEQLVEYARLVNPVTTGCFFSPVKSNFI